MGERRVAMLACVVDPLRLGGVPRCRLRYRSAKRCPRIHLPRLSDIVGVAGGPNDGNLDPDCLESGQGQGRSEIADEHGT